MKRHGSSNAELFAVHESTYLPGFAGEVALAVSQGAVVGFGQKDDTPYLPWINNIRAGSVRTWVYEDEIENPQIWGIGDSEGNIIYAWEAESGVTEWDNELNPIASLGNNGLPVIPDCGALKRLQFPGYSFDGIVLDVMNQLETLVAAAALPSWLARSPFQYMTEAGDVVNALWRWKCNQRYIKIYKDLADQKSKMQINQRDRMFSLLWMRAASMILYNHQGDSCIPLLLNRFRMDLSNGNLSLNS